MSDLYKRGEQQRNLLGRLWDTWIPRIRKNPWQKLVKKEKELRKEEDNEQFRK